ncbi:HTH-type transcriptional regulator/antitoxin HipB [Cryobacterium sp. MP_M5]|uniref:helix-turn-helix domain-containing protein n=1 Tax=unclassified Cryobacterium TaxID=2649013 RepID=UPI0018CAB957|nr:MULTISPECIES: helix-turn-helix transcriptional regulator [unclassified Cryobacterium]MBG6060021.1 transcriptional regulator with XRE-family HTH domain [Cryobacterium sp. MP_M3]MEC5178457.1 HTH-type transcriptional regulator/antitoxin HipB [Cryobacterium sp. MP_M5]
MTARGEVKSARALGRMLQQGRLVSGLTQRDLAVRLETDQKYIWALESGKNTIILERIFAIMRETGIRMYMEIDNSLYVPLHDMGENPNG